jgi:DnaJ-domain-containing protein 1
MIDPFAALGLPHRFDLTQAAIERAYLGRIAASHPDAVGRGGRDDDSGDAAALNDAKAALLDDGRRAEALLAHLGGPTANQERALPPGFLEEMLDVRERLDADLDADPVGARPRWRDWAQARRETHVAVLQGLFARTPAPLRDIRLILNQWRYIERMLEQLDT